MPWMTYEDFHVNIYHTSYYYGNESLKLSVKENEQLIQEIEQYRALRGMKLHPISYLESSYLKQVAVCSYRQNSHALPLLCVRHVYGSMGNVYPCSMYDRRQQYSPGDYAIRPIWDAEESKKCSTKFGIISVLSAGRLAKLSEHFQIFLRVEWKPQRRNRVFDKNPVPLYWVGLKIENFEPFKIGDRLLIGHSIQTISQKFRLVSRRKCYRNL